MELPPAAQHRPGRLRRAGRHRPGRVPPVLGGPARLRGQLRDPGHALYLRGYDELIHHNLILRAGPVPPRPGSHTGSAARLTWTWPRRSSRRSDAGPRGCRPASRRAWGRRSGPRTRSVSPSSSSSTPNTASACSSGTTCGAGPNPPGSTTSTSWSPTSGRRTSTTGRSASACPRRSRTPRRSTPPGCSASRPCTTWRSPGERGRACTTWGSSPTSRTRCCGSATSWARCTPNPKSSEAPAGTGCPTPSTCTCGTRTGTGWRSTPATTSPATPVIPCCAGQCATRGAGTSGATR